MPRLSIASQVLEALARERRVLVADWRFHVLYMRIAQSGSLKLPRVEELNALIRRLRSAGDISPIKGVSGVFRVTVPYASTLPAPELLVVQEANPFAVFAYFTALAHHELTDTIPSQIDAVNYRKSQTRVPLGTSPDDWIDVPEPSRRTPRRIGGVGVNWSQTKANWDFGHTIAYVHGCPMYITDLERTLLDSLRFPGKSGGVLEVFRAWKRAAEGLRLSVMIEYVRRFGQALLRQRVGFMLEQLGFSDPSLDEWAGRSIRGSSAKLVACRAFSSEFSGRWNLSINVPVSVLCELRDS